MDNYLVMENITKVYDNGVMANNGVNFSAKKGEIHAICGENGAGKTTLMKMLFGIERPDQGQIYIKGNPVHLTSPLRQLKLESVWCTSTLCLFLHLQLLKMLS